MVFNQDIELINYSRFRSSVQGINGFMSIWLIFNSKESGECTRESAFMSVKNPESFNWYTKKMKQFRTGMIKSVPLCSGYIWKDRTLKISSCAWVFSLFRISCISYFHSISQFFFSLLLIFFSNVTINGSYVEF